MHDGVLGSDFHRLDHLSVSSYIAHISQHTFNELALAKIIIQCRRASKYGNLPYVVRERKYQNEKVLSRIGPLIGVIYQCLDRISATVRTLHVTKHSEKIV